MLSKPLGRITRRSRRRHRGDGGVVRSSGRPDLLTARARTSSSPCTPASRCRPSRTRCTPRASSPPPLAFQIDTTIFGSFSGRRRARTRSHRARRSRTSARSSADRPTSSRLTCRAGLTLARGGASTSRTARALPTRTRSSTTRRSTNTPSPFRTSGSLEGLIGTGQYIITPGETPAPTRHAHGADDS